MSVPQRFHASPTVNEIPSSMMAKLPKELPARGRGGEGGSHLEREYGYVRTAMISRVSDS